VLWVPYQSDITLEVQCQSAGLLNFSHHSAHLGLLHRRFERRQVNLTESPLAADGAPLVFLILMLTPD